MVANVEQMMYYGQKPWHGLGVEIKEKVGVEEAIELAGLNWDVTKIPLKVVDEYSEDFNLSEDVFNKIAGETVNTWATVRCTDGQILGTKSGKNYEVLQNRDAFTWFEPFIESGETFIETAGSLNSGRRIWILATLNRDPIKISGEDTINKHLLLANSHDGTLAVHVALTPVRVVCWNTLDMAIRSKATKSLRVKHTRSVKSTLDEIRTTINMIDQEFETTAEHYRFLRSKDISPIDLQKYVRVLFGVERKMSHEISTRTNNQIEKVTELFETQLGKQYSANSYWAAYQAYNQYLVHVKGRNVATRLNSLWFGPSAVQNKKALELALEMCA